MIPSGGVACGLHVILAKSAPVAAVFRRGPTKRWVVLRWNLESLEVEQGNSFHGLLYPRRCNISPDGRLLGYFALKDLHPEAPWHAFFAVSKLPWLTALAAWRTGGTYTTYCSFEADLKLLVIGDVEEEPFHGEYPPGSKMVPFLHEGMFLGELDRGWGQLGMDEAARFTEYLSARAFPKRPGSGKLPKVFRKPRGPRAGTALILGYGGRGGRIESEGLCYVLELGTGKIESLQGVTWADWDRWGRLLAATDRGELRVSEFRGSAFEPIWVRDMNPIQPDSRISPAWARDWKGMQ